MSKLLPSQFADIDSLPWQEVIVWAVAALSLLIILLYTVGVRPRQRRAPGLRGWRGTSKR